MLEKTKRRTAAARGLACLTVLICASAAKAGDGISTAPASPSTTNAAPADSLSAYKAMSLEQLMNLEVTSVSKAPEAFREAPASIDVVTQDDIRAYGAQSIPEALRLADNLEVAQTGSSTYDISARGFNNGTPNKLLVLMDGRSIYTPLFSGVIWNMQDYLMADIDRIEVISGPGGTLWGANAVNGVINITTKDAKDTQGVYLDGGGGTYLQDFADARYGGMLASNVYYRVYAKYFDAGPENYTNGGSVGDNWDRGQAGFRVDDYSSSQDHITLEGDGMGGYTDVRPGGQGTALAEGKASSGHLLGRWTHSFSDESELSVQAYYDREDMSAPFQGFGAIPAGPLQDSLDTYDLITEDRFTIGDRQRMVVGAEYRFTHDVVDEAPLAAFLPATLDQDLFSIYGQDEIKLREGVWLTLGTKIEHNDYTGFEFEPSIRLQWDMTEGQMVWGAISRAVRTPSRYDRDLYEPNPVYGTLLAGNDSFQSEDLLAYELGYRAQVTPRVALSASSFYNVYDHLQSLNYSNSVSLPVYWSNDDSARTYGIELNSTWQALDWWRLHVGYDLLKEDIHVGPGGDADDGLNLTADPQQQFFLRSAMELPHGIEFDNDFRWIDRVHNNNGAAVGVIPAYAELNMRLAWHASKNWEVAMVGQNLLHAQHVEAGYPGTTQEAIVRNVYGEVTFRY